MSIQVPVRLGPAEEALVAQLLASGDKDAAERFRATGLPTRRVETYHYTDLKALIRSLPDLAQAATSAGQPALRIPDAYRVLIANGAVDEHAGTAPAGVMFGKTVGPVLTTRDDVLVRINSGLARQALRLDLNGSVDPVIHVDRRIEGEAAHVADGASIYVADGASATVLETTSGSAAAHIGNHASFVSLGRNAHLTHIVVDLSAREATHFASIEYNLGEGAQLRSIVVHAGSILARSQIFARFAGKGAHGDFGGLNLADDGQHLDITLQVEHAVPDTTSRELFKQVGRGRSRAVFQGKIVVARDAQRVDAKLMTQGLMLSDRAEVFSKPELEIFADDVQCGHGSTCGEVDDQSLFYLMSRGIPQPVAEAMLIRAFLAELIDPIGDDYVRSALNDIVDDWLERDVREAAA